RFVSFFRAATNLVPGGGNGSANIFRRDVLGAADPPARISINDVSHVEGDAGRSGFRFAVSLDRTESHPVTVGFSTSNGTATAPGDYSSTSWRLTFLPGETAKTVTVQVHGDTRVESDEAFTVNLASVTGKATIADPQAVGTIRNDDVSAPPPPPPARISIADVRHLEGNSGRSRFRFTVSLDRTEATAVRVAFSTANRTARAPGDYANTRGTISFAPGETSKTITVSVKGDKKKERNEKFSVDLANPVGNATLVRGHAVG